MITLESSKIIDNTRGRELVNVLKDRLKNVMKLNLQWVTSS